MPREKNMSTHAQLGPHGVLKTFNTATAMKQPALDTI